MSSYMWNPAYYLNQNQESQQYSQTTQQYDQQIINSIPYSPLNSSHETNSSKSSNNCNSSYLESPLSSSHSQYANYKSCNQTEIDNSCYAPNYQTNQSYSTEYQQQQLRSNYFAPQTNQIYSPARSVFENQTNYYKYYYNQGNSTPVTQANYYTQPASTSQNFSPESTTSESNSQYHNNSPKDQIVKSKPVAIKQSQPKPAVKGPKEIEGPKSNKNVTVKMEDMSIWSKFNQAGTEMIVTKTGRRMFPSLRCSVSGLNSTSRYNMIVDIVPADDDRYKFQAGKWIVNGKADAHFSGRGYLHPDSALTGAQWMKHIISFHKLKITNNPFDRAGHIILNSMQKFVPRLHLIEVDGKSSNTFVFPEATFMAVTAYQNDLITKLKIEYNPFAKGFRECQTRKEKRDADEVLENNYSKMPNYSMITNF